jgi:hypothetical protein
MPTTTIPLSQADLIAFIILVLEGRNTEPYVSIITPNLK